MTDEKKERLEVNDLPVEEELTDEEQKQTKGGIANAGPVSVPESAPMRDQIQGTIDDTQQSMQQTIDDNTGVGGDVPGVAPLNKPNSP